MLCVSKAYLPQSWLHFCERKLVENKPFLTQVIQPLNFDAFTSHSSLNCHDFGRLNHIHHFGAGHCSSWPKNLLVCGMNFISKIGSNSIVRDANHICYFGDAHCSLWSEAPPMCTISITLDLGIVFHGWSPTNCTCCCWSGIKQITRQCRKALVKFDAWAPPAFPISNPFLFKQSQCNM